MGAIRADHRWQEEFLNHYEVHKCANPPLTGRLVVKVTTWHSRAALNPQHGKATCALCHLPAREQLAPGDVLMQVTPTNAPRRKNGVYTAVHATSRLVLSVSVIAETLPLTVFYGTCAPHWVHTRRADRAWKTRFIGIRAGAQSKHARCPPCTARNNMRTKSVMKRRGSGHVFLAKYGPDDVQVEWRHRHRARYHGPSVPIRVCKRDFNGKVLIMNSWAIFPGDETDPRAVTFICPTETFHTFDKYQTRIVVRTRFAVDDSRRDGLYTLISIRSPNADLIRFGLPILEWLRLCVWFVSVAMFESLVDDRRLHIGNNSVPFNVNTRVRKLVQRILCRKRRRH